MKLSTVGVNGLLCGDLAFFKATKTKSKVTKIKSPKAKRTTKKATGGKKRGRKPVIQISFRTSFTILITQEQIYNMQPSPGLVAPFLSDLVNVTEFLKPLRNSVLVRACTEEHALPSFLRIQNSI